MLQRLRILIDVDVDLAELKVAGEQLEARVDAAMLRTRSFAITSSSSTS